MTERTKPRRRTLIGFVVATLVVMPLTLGSRLSLASGTTAPLDPDREHFGRSYADLAGDWWNWAGQFPLARNPIVETGPVDCSRGQSGRIWFLAGNFGGAAGEPNPSDRTCTLPAGKALFLPLANSLFWAPEDGGTVEEVRRKANDGIAPISALSLTIDGVGVTDLFAYRAQSPPGGFALRYGPLLADFGFDPGTRAPAVADGYWVLLAALPSGRHTIVIHSSDGAALNVDVTYHLQVGPGH